MRKIKLYNLDSRYKRNYTKRYYKFILIFFAPIMIYFMADSALGGKILQSYIENQIKDEKANLVRREETLQLLADTVFNNLINRANVIDIFKRAYKSTGEEKRYIREKLFNLLNDKYVELKKLDIQQLHFHLPDNESFLRFHKPNKFGDNLSKIRETVVYVNRYKKPISGFEEGKIFNGFRYVYPIFDYDNNHIGSVEISSSSNSYKKFQEKKSTNKMDFIIRKDVVAKKVFKDEQSKNYMPYALNDNFLLQRSLIDYDKQTGSYDLKLGLITELDRQYSVVDKMNKMETIIQPIRYKGHYNLITFLPVENFMTKEKVAYIVNFTKSDFLDNFFLMRNISFITVILFSFSLVFILYVNNKLLYLGKILNESLNEIYIFDMKTLKFTYVNEKASKNIGYSLDELKNMTPIDINPGYNNKNLLMKLKPLLEGTTDVITLETMNNRKDGSSYSVEIQLELMTVENRLQFVAILKDVTERNAIADKLKKSEFKYSHLIESVQEHYFFYEHDEHGIFTYVSDSVTGVLGYSQKEFLNHYKTYLTDEEINSDIVEKIDNVLLNKKQEPYVISIYHKDGSIKYLEVTEVALFGRDGAVIGADGIARDVTDIHMAKDELEYQAYHDLLTKLPNRILLKDRMQRAIIKANRNNKQIAILFIDLDRFKQINDSIGHDVGDDVLKITSERLQSTVREEDTVSRIGGDEFIVMIEGVNDTDSVGVLAGKIITNLSEVINIKNHKLYISASIGISLYPDNAMTSEDLIKYADFAMYESKNSGRSMFSFFS